MPDRSFDGKLGVRNGGVVVKEALFGAVLSKAGLNQGYYISCVHIYILYVYIQKKDVSPYTPTLHRPPPKYHDDWNGGPGVLNEYLWDVWGLETINGNKKNKHE